MDEIEFKSKEVIQPNYYKFFKDMAIINVDRVEDLLTVYKMKMANEIPNSWSVINQLFNELNNKIFEKELEDIS
jgi:hypothetical protein